MYLNISQPVWDTLAQDDFLLVIYFHEDLDFDSVRDIMYVYDINKFKKKNGFICIDPVKNIGK